MTRAELIAMARWHALAAWIATLTVAAAAWAHLSARGRRFAVWIGAAAAIALSVAAALGLWMHDGYRARLRQRLFLEAPSLGWLFERKLHASFGAVMLALAGAAISAAIARVAAKPAQREVQRAAAIAWTVAALLTAAATIASLIVARRAHF